MFNLQKKQTKKYLSIGIPIVVVLGIGLKLSDELSSNRFDDVLGYFNLKTTDSRFLVAVVFCSLLNWSLEALKWRDLIKPIENVSFFKSLASVFAGLSIGFFTPRSVGDYLGRALLLESKQRFEVFGGLLVSRVSQMLATVIVGLTGLFYLRDQIAFIQDLRLVFYLSVLFFVVILLAYFFRKQLITRFMKFKHIRNVVKLFSIIKNYKSQLYLRVFIISILRYFSFLLQFIFVALLLTIDFQLLPFLAVVSSVLLLKSVVVSFNFFSDLGMRELACMMLFPLINISLLDGVLIGVVVWGFNVLLPSIFGSFMVWKTKW